MRNLIRGMLIVATLSVGVGTSLTSCKDNYDELRNEIGKNNIDLTKKIADLQAVVDNLKTLQEQCKANCEAAIAALNAQIELLKGDLANKADSAWVAGEISRLEGMIPDISGLEADVVRLDSLIDGINLRLNQIDTTLNSKADKDYVDSLVLALTTDLNNLRTELGQNMEDLRADLEAQIRALSLEVGNKVDQSVYDAFVAAQEEVNRQVEANQIAIANIEQTLQTLDATIKAVEDKADKAYAQAMSNLAHLNALIARVDAIQQQQIPALEGRLDAMETEALALRNELNELKDQVEANTNDIELLAQKMEIVNSKVDQLLNRAKVQITSMNVEQVYNFTYGTFDTPFGVKSNFLLSFYGKADQPVGFPGNGNEFDSPDQPVLTQADLNMLGVQQMTYDGLLIRGTDDNNFTGNAGEIYFQVNPARVDLTNTDFSLVNSRGDVFGATVEKPVKTDEILYFGATHGRSNNPGLYKAAVTLGSMEAVEGVKIQIEEGLGQAAKDVLKERSLSSLAMLSKLIYDQVSKVMPKAALRADWKVGEEINSTYSPFDLGVSAVRPLSFAFLYDKSVPGRRFPILDPLTELINSDDFKVDLTVKPIEFEDFKFEITDPQVSIDDFGDLWIDFYINGQHIHEKVDGTKNLTTAIENAIKSAIGSITSQIESQVQQIVADMQNQIKSQIDSMLENLVGQINGQIVDLINKINNKTAPFIDRYNQFLPKYNQLAKLINRIMDNPNAYLQNLMVYQASTEGGFHVLSNNINRPTRLRVDGGDAIYLYPTTRTGETIAPAFKKFVGVTNAWRTDDPTHNAKENGGVLKNLVDQINAAGNMDQIINGEDMHVTLYVPGTAKGNTLEIVYQALDYHGITSTQRYYVTVE